MITSDDKDYNFIPSRTRLPEIPGLFVKGDVILPAFDQTVGIEFHVGLVCRNLGPMVNRTLSFHVEGMDESKLCRAKLCKEFA